MLLFECLTLKSVAVLPGTLTLAWDPSSDPTVVGYRLYQGTASQQYNTMADLGSNLTAVVFNLVAGTTYYFAVTAYDSAGLESAFSGEISYTMPTSAPSSPGKQLQLSISQNNSGQAVLRGIGAPGFVYDVYASTNLSLWLVIGSITADLSGSFQFTDPQSYASRWQFYRLRQSVPQSASAQ